MSQVFYRHKTVNGLVTPNGYVLKVNCMRQHMIDETVSTERQRQQIQTKNEKTHTLFWYARAYLNI